MKRIASLLLGLAMAAAALSGCGAQGRETAAQEFPDAVSIVLSDDGIIVDGKAVSTDESAAVHTAHDIVCYESGRDFALGDFRVTPLPISHDAADPAGYLLP